MFCQSEEQLKLLRARSYQSLQIQTWIYIAISKAAESEEESLRCFCVVPSAVTHVGEEVLTSQAWFVRILTVLFCTDAHDRLSNVLSACCQWF